MHQTTANRMLDTYENGKSITAYNKTGSGYRATERQKIMDRYQGCCGKTAGLGAKAADARPGSMCGWILYSFTWDKTTRIMTQECNSNYWPACADGFYLGQHNRPELWPKSSTAITDQHARQHVWLQYSSTWSTTDQNYDPKLQKQPLIIDQSPYVQSPPLWTLLR